QALRLGAQPSVPAEVQRVLGAPEPWLKLLTRGGATPQMDEVGTNPRAASARLRAAERIGWAA
ncbi:MAG: 16S rRNA (cytosine(1402)-N(4))-methyltransferase, partial [Actinomycetales bacterium]